MDILVSLVENVDKNYDSKRIVYLEIPLWSSLVKTEVNLKNLILLASTKICNFNNKKNDYLANFVCIACTLTFEVSLQITVNNLMATAIEFFI